MSAPHPVAPIGRLALAALAGIALAGCATTSTLEPTAVAATPGAALTAQTSPVATTAASASPAAEARLSCEPLGEPMPRYTVTVPGGWSGYQGECGFVVRDGEGFTAGLSAWIVGQVRPTRAGTVPRSPRQRTGGRPRQGDPRAGGPERDQPRGRVTRGLPGHVRGVDGPGRGAVHGRGRVPRRRLRQRELPQLERPYRRDPLSAGAGQVDRLWILDVGGKPVVIDASYAPDAPAAAREELAAIVDTLRFEVP